ncbi:hypothetical protein CFHF_18960 [Caulobacter flavus]|uniref:Restriction endonuclease type IV Mrr domain-containing protein n=1 Tax=Caulobacter flavus TaxID=1679497 RepID=A0A2N5CPY4_9CAUL|nr:restriction endonuclease [Caulobacter flavus]PLR09218.1 hypothetical protein CFHF_18960 [Caulobacter flavus]
MVSEDEFLERIVAGIQAVTTSDAEVRWNDKINGRQFDVSVRFKLGTLRYLVVVEVKNRTRKTPAADLEAFVTKASDQRANKKVFVSAAGFQSGAIEVAKAHGVDLFTVTYDETEPQLPRQMSTVTLRNPLAPPGMEPEIEIGEPTITANLEHLKVIYAGGPSAVLPNEQSALNYYLAKSRLADGRGLMDVVCQPIFDLDLGEVRHERVVIDPPQQLSVPDEFFVRRGLVIALEWTITGRMGRAISGTVRFDPGMLTKPVVYTNVITGEALRFSIDQLPLGSDGVQVGRFYFITTPLNYYYCAGIDGKTVTWHIIESFQCGELFQGTFTQQIEWTHTYIPVADKKILRRLEKRLQTYLLRRNAERAA